jgi:hypothetical protein
MLPAAYQMPAALVLLLGGAVSCFYGYRSFRIVLAIFGFVIGALIPSSFLSMSSGTWTILAVALAGGLMGAGVMFAAYFVGVSLVGAGLGAVAANLMFAATGQDPHYMVLVLLTLLGAAAAMYLQRYFIIVGTAFGGAWTLIVGAAALFGDRTALAAAAANDVWVAYPLNPAPGRGWVKLAWIVLGLVGATVQLGWTGGERGRVVRRKKKS